MPSESDIQYIAAAVKAALLSRARAEEIHDILETHEEMGMPASAQEIAVKKGYLTEAQAESLARSLAAKIRITGYDLTEKVGTGGMGSVWRARQTALDRDVAIKILPPSAAADPEFVQRFLTEARAVAKLNHENIVQGIDVGESGGYYYFAMEFVDGPTVRELVEAGGPLPEMKALEIAEGVARGLAHAHAAGIIHRDVKPGNIILTADGVPKLADLGLAKRAGDASATDPGMAIGTPYYMSPEQAGGHAAVDGRSDIYSLGATLFYVLTGSPPFEGKTAAEVMAKHIDEEIDPVRDLRRDVSPAVSKFVQWLTKKKPESRPQTAEAVMKEIGRLRSARPAPPRITTEHRRSSSRLPASGRGRSGVAVAAVTAVVVTVAAILLLAGSGRLGTATRRRPARTGPGDGAGDIGSPGLPPAARAPDAARRGPDLDSMSEEDLKRFVDADPRGEHAGAARSRLARLIEERKLAELKERAFAEVIAAGRFSEALALAAAGETGRLLRPEATGRVEAAAMDAMRPLRDRARRASGLTGPRLDELVASLQALDLKSMPRLDKMRTDSVRELQGEIAARARRTEAAYAEFRARLIESLARGDRTGAARIAGGVLGEPGLSAAHERVRRDLEWVKSLDEVEAAAARGAGALVGKSRNFETRAGGRAGGRIIRVDDRRIVFEIRARGGTIETVVGMDKLAPAEVAELARSSAPDDAALRGSVAFYLIAAGLADEAAAELEWLAAKGTPSAELAAFLDVVRSAAAESSAAAEWPAIEKAIAAKRWEEASRLAAKFTGAHGGTDFARSKADSLRRISAALAGAAMKGRALASTEGLLFYAPLDKSGADAAFAAGSAKARAARTTFTSDGRRDGAARIRHGGYIRYERPGNMKLAAGTVMLWARASAGGGLWHSDERKPLFACGTGNNRFTISAMGRELVFDPRTAGGEHASIDVGRWLIKDWNDTKWHHAAVAWRASNGRGVAVLYGDGRELGRRDMEMPSALAGSIVIGLYDDTYRFDGSVDELYIHDRILQPEEIYAAARVRAAPSRPWRRLFNLMDDAGLILADSWEAERGVLNHTGESSLQTREEFSDGEVEVTFRVRRGDDLSVAVRQGAAGRYRLRLGGDETRALGRGWHRIRFTMRGDSVTATVDGRRKAVLDRGSPRRGRIQIGGDGSSIRISEIRYRPLGE